MANDKDKNKLTQETVIEETVATTEPEVLDVKPTAKSGKAGVVAGKVNESPKKTIEVDVDVLTRMQQQIERLKPGYDYSSSRR
jgi:predicted Mrr-cat superfamily restriction endonuclease